MKPYTIKNAFSESEMWPINAKAGIEKMRQYTRSIWKKKKANVKQIPQQLYLIILSVKLKLRLANRLIVIHVHEVVLQGNDMSKHSN